MEQSQSLVNSLEAVAKQHEDSVVIELGTDRLIKWLGVYTILFLAIVAKIGDLVGELYCYFVCEWTCIL